MGIDTLLQGITLFNAALSALKNAINLLPDNPHKADIEAVYEKACRELRIAEAEIANKLKYQICRAHFPPGIMLSKDGKHWGCPECKNTTDTSKKFLSISLKK